MPNPSCPRTPSTDWAAYLVDPTDPAWGDLPQHFPTCPDCAEALARWTRFAEAIDEQAGLDASVLLARHAEHPNELTTEERRRVDLLLQRPQFRDELDALHGFAFPDAEPNEDAPSTEPDSSPARSWAHPHRWAWGAALLAVIAFFWAGSAGLPPTAPEVQVAVVPQAPDEPAPRPEPPADGPAATPTAEPTPPDAGAIAAEKRDTDPAPPLIDPTHKPIVLASAYPSSPPNYAAPFPDQPGSRFSAVVRSGSSRTILALAPAHLGHTIEASPTLAFWLPQAWDHDVSLLVRKAEGGRTLGQHTIPGPLAAGFHDVDLAALGLALEANVPTTWAVSLIGPDGPRLGDPTSGASLERVEAPTELSAALDAAPKEERAWILARHGLWHDAWAVLGEAPETVASRSRAALLDQVGLPAPARAAATQPTR